MMKANEEAHKDCVTNQNEALKKIMQLELVENEYKDKINDLVKEKNGLIGKVSGYENEIRLLREQLDAQREK